MKKTLSFILCIVLLMYFPGCSFKGKPDPVVKDFCKAMKAFDLEAMQNCTVLAGEGGPSIDDGSPVVQALYEHLSTYAQEMKYSIKSCSVSGDTGTVVVEFSYLDAAPIVEASIADFIPQLIGLALTNADDALVEATFMNILAQKSSEMKPQVLQQLVAIPCIYTDDGWKISEVPDEIMNVLMSNIQDVENALGGFGEEETQSETEEETVWHNVLPGTSIELATIKVTVLDTIEATSIVGSDSTDKAQSGAKFIVMDIEVENITKDTIHFDISNYHFVDSKERRFEPYDEDIWILGDTIHYADLAPNIPQRGYVVYQVPSDAAGYYLGIIKKDTTDGYRFYGNATSKILPSFRLGETPPKSNTEQVDPIFEKDDFQVGYVNADGGLRIRSGPGTGYDEVGRLPNGEAVTIYEIQSEGNRDWGRIDGGWICMDYIVYEKPSTSNTSNPDDYLIDTFVGKWEDNYSQRCHMEVSYWNGLFYFDITWGNSAFSTSYWTMSGEYDVSSGSVRYYDGKYSIIETKESGEQVEKVQYTNGEGLFTLAKPYLYWDDYEEWAGINCEFEKRG